VEDWDHDQRWNCWISWLVSEHANLTRFVGSVCHCFLKMMLLSMPLWNHNFELKHALYHMLGDTAVWKWVWHWQLCNLSTIMREYTSLHSVGVLPFVNVILSGTYSATNETGSVPAQGWWNIPQPLLEYLKLSHNDSQLQAIQVHSLLWATIWSVQPLVTNPRSTILQ
jgi:hypothetical protein